MERLGINQRRKMLLAFLTVVIVAIVAVAGIQTSKFITRNIEKNVVEEVQKKGLGPPGESAYEIAVRNGFEGTEREWLLSLQGERGRTGMQGRTGAQGLPGAPGAKGEQGNEGRRGRRGRRGDDGRPGIRGLPGVSPDIEQEVNEAVEKALADVDERIDAAVQDLLVQLCALDQANLIC